MSRDLILGKTRRSWSRGLPAPEPVSDSVTEILGRDEILGCRDVGEDELSLAAEGGAAERAALARRRK